MANQLSLSLYDELISSFDDIAGTTTRSEVAQKARKKAFNSFKNTGFPTRKNEEWKYTNITSYLQEKYTVNGFESSFVQNELIASAKTK